MLARFWYRRLFSDRREMNVRNIHGWAVVPVGALCAALTFMATTSGTSYADDPKDAIQPSQVQQGFAASPIPKDKLNLAGKNPYLVALGSYLVNGPGDCSGCHSLPRFLRPAGTAPVTGNPQHNYTGQGSNPNDGDPFLDPPD